MHQWSVVGSSPAPWPHPKAKMHFCTYMWGSSSFPEVAKGHFSTKKTHKVSARSSIAADARVSQGKHAPSPAASPGKSRFWQYTARQWERTHWSFLIQPALFLLNSLDKGHGWNSRRSPPCWEIYLSAWDLSSKASEQAKPPLSSHGHGANASEGWRIAKAGAGS